MRKELIITHRQIEDIQDEIHNLGQIFNELTTTDKINKKTGMKILKCDCLKGDLEFLRELISRSNEEYYKKHWHDDIKDIEPKLQCAEYDLKELQNVIIMINFAEVITDEGFKILNESNNFTMLLNRKTGSKKDLNRSNINDEMKKTINKCMVRFQDIVNNLKNQK